MDLSINDFPGLMVRFLHIAQLPFGDLTQFPFLLLYTHENFSKDSAIRQR